MMRQPAAGVVSAAGQLGHHLRWEALLLADSMRVVRRKPPTAWHAQPRAYSGAAAPREHSSRVNPWYICSLADTDSART
jgi:hypothetical protein